jgi:hypothetical protein
MDWSQAAEDLLRLASLLATMALGLALYMGTNSLPGSAALGLILCLGGVVGSIAALSGSRQLARRLDAVVLVGILAGLGGWTFLATQENPAYGTDGIALDEGAAVTLLEGRNPYASDLSWALDRYRVPPSYWTLRLDGGFVTQVSYPAASFLIYLPPLALGLHTQVAVWVDVAFWALTLVVLWRALPPPLRPLASVVGTLGVYLGFAVGGVTEPTLLPFLLAGLRGWDRFADPDAKRRWAAPLSMGLACAVKQSAWFMVPFLGVGLWWEAHQRGVPAVRRVLEYTGLVLVGFLGPNLPFMVWDPGAWWHGVTLPFLQPLVPLGQGLVSLSLYQGLGGGDLRLYTLGATFVLASGLLALAGWYERLKPALPALPALALLFPTRSLANYFLYLTLALFVTVTSTRRPDRAPGPSWLRRGCRALAGLAGTLALLAVAGALASPAPLAVRALGLHTTGQLQSVDQLDLVITNRSDRTIQPRFTTGLGPFFSFPWVILSGPSVLGPKETGRYLLGAPDPGSMPSLAQDLVVYAFSVDPPTVSVARLLPAFQRATIVSPQIVSTPTARVELVVQLVDRFNHPLQQEGVTVALGQVLYAQEGLLPGEAIVNDRPQGASPVLATTDANGQAHFVVRAGQPQPYEVFFQAWLPAPYPHGYSNMVSVRLRADQSEGVPYLPAGATGRSGRPASVP